MKQNLTSRRQRQAKRRERKALIREHEEKRAALAKRIREFEGWKSRTLAAAKEACVRARVARDARIAELRERQQRELAELRALERANVKTACGTRPKRIASRYDRKVKKARKAHDTHGGAIATLKHDNRASTMGADVAAQKRAYEKVQERKDFELADVPPELQGLFRSVRSKLPKKARTSPAEVFAEWVEAHPDAVWAFQEKEGAKLFKRDLRAHEALEAELHRLEELERKAIEREGETVRESAEISDDSTPF